MMTTWLTREGVCAKESAVCGSMIVRPARKLNPNVQQLRNIRRAPEWTNKRFTLGKVQAEKNRREFRLAERRESLSFAMLTMHGNARNTVEGGGKFKRFECFDDDLHESRLLGGCASLMHSSPQSLCGGVQPNPESYFRYSVAAILV